MDRARHQTRNAPYSRGEYDQLFNGREMYLDVCLINEGNRHFYRPESEGDFSFDCCTTFVLSGEPFLSVHQTSKNAVMSKSIVCGHLTQTMRWKLGHLQGVPHSLTESENMNRVQEQQHFWSFSSQSGTKRGDTMSPLTTPGFIEKSIGSGDGLQRMMSREQGRDEGQSQQNDIDHLLEPEWAPSH
jgi:hypothetical protein